MFANKVGRWGEDWRGVIFRQTYPQLADVVAKSLKWFPRAFEGVHFNRARMAWEWDTGDTLLFRHINRISDYDHYHGHEYPFIGFEELTNWPDDKLYKLMLSCCRSSREGVPRMVRATCNPYGVGHHWVKERWKLHGQWWLTIMQEIAGKDGGVWRRTAIHGHLSENKTLLKASPDYADQVVAAASTPAQAKAWSFGDWDVVAGGMFGDVWEPAANVVSPFEIPSQWRILRAFDWGSARPFSVGWYAVSDGCDIRLEGGEERSTIRGDIFRVREWYGCTGKPNEGLRMLSTDIAKGIVEREMGWGWRTEENPKWCRVSDGPADSAIFNVEDGPSIADNMEKRVRFRGLSWRGITWDPADKRAGSRRLGWELLRDLMRAARPAKPELPRERPGLFVVGDHNPQFLRTVPSLPTDAKDLDDVDTDAEDHIGDEVRYLVRSIDGLSRVFQRVPL